MMLVRLSLLLLVTIPQVVCPKVIDRFPDWRSFRGRCRIAFPQPLKTGSYESPFMVKLFAKQFTQFSALNCTLVPADFLNSGLNLNSNGSYDGMAGMIQRNEIDVTPYLYRSDFFVIQPGHLTTTGLPADVDIIMKKNESETICPGLIEVWSSEFDLMTIVFILISLFIFTTVLAFTSSFPSADVTNPLTLTTRIAVNLQKALFSMVDQENFDPENDSSRVLVLFFNFFLLFAVHGILSGVIGAEMVFDVNHPIYESLNDFSNDSWVQPTVIHNLWLLPVLEKTRNGSSLWPLRQAVFAHPKENLMRFEMRSQYALAAAGQHLFREITSGTRALIAPRFVHENAHDIMCTLMPDQMKSFAHSKSSFAEGLLVSLMSYQIDPLLKKLISYLTTTATETGLSKGTFRMTHLHVYESDQVPKDDKDWSKNKNKCLEGFRHEKREPAAFEVELFIPIFWQLGIAIACALMILMAEVLCQLINWSPPQVSKEWKRLIAKHKKRFRRKMRKWTRVAGRNDRGKKRRKRRTTVQQEPQRPDDRIPA